MADSPYNLRKVVMLIGLALVFATAVLVGITSNVVAGDAVESCEAHAAAAIDSALAAGRQAARNSTFELMRAIADGVAADVVSGSLSMAVAEVEALARYMSLFPHDDAAEWDFADQTLRPMMAAGMAAKDTRGLVSVGVWGGVDPVSARPSWALMLVSPESIREHEMATFRDYHGFFTVQIENSHTTPAIGISGADGHLIPRMCPTQSLEGCRGLGGYSGNDVLGFGGEHLKRMASHADIGSARWGALGSVGPFAVMQVSATWSAGGNLADDVAAAQPGDEPAGATGVQRPSPAEGGNCTDDEYGNLKAEGYTCDMLLHLLDCDMDIAPLSGGRAPPGTYLRSLCKASCGVCAAEGARGQPPPPPPATAGERRGAKGCYDEDRALRQNGFSCEVALQLIKCDTDLQPFSGGRVPEGTYLSKFCEKSCGVCSGGGTGGGGGRASPGKGSGKGKGAPAGTAVGVAWASVDTRHLTLHIRSLAEYLALPAGHRIYAVAYSADAERQPMLLGASHGDVVRHNDPRGPIPQAEGLRATDLDVDRVIRNHVLLAAAAPGGYVALAEETARAPVDWSTPHGVYPGAPLVSYLVSARTLNDGRGLAAWVIVLMPRDAAFAHAEAIGKAAKTDLTAAAEEEAGKRRLKLSISVLPLAACVLGVAGCALALLRYVTPEVRVGRSPKGRATVSNRVGDELEMDGVANAVGRGESRIGLGAAAKGGGIPSAYAADAGETAS